MRQANSYTAIGLIMHSLKRQCTGTLYANVTAYDVNIPVWQLLPMYPSLQMHW